MVIDIREVQMRTSLILAVCLSLQYCPNLASANPQDKPNDNDGLSHVKDEKNIMVRKEGFPNYSSSIKLEINQAFVRFLNWVG
jgi:hypothetical protein